jgi:hypothetical protein
MDDRLTRMIVATAALAAFATMLAGPAGASRSEARQAQAAVTVVPYLSQGVGIDPSQLAGDAAPRLTGVHAALALDRHEDTRAGALLEKQSPTSEPSSLGLTGDSPLTRVSAPEPEGLTGDMALTRVPWAAPAATAVSGNDVDWTSFGAGAGIAALLAAALAGILLASRRRHTVGMP